MGISTHLQKAAIVTVLILLHLAAAGQVLIKGTVYERTARMGMPGVSVRSTSGTGTVTDSLGNYSIRLNYTDSLSFSYQGKPTMKFPVIDIPPHQHFDISLHVDVKMLKTVEVTTNRIHDYKFDSLENRNEYRKVFDFEPNYISSASNGAGAGLNLDLLLSMKKVKRMEAFRRRLEADEREKYVDHRFNIRLVKEITGLESPALDTFMVQYRPSYDMIQGFENEYEYYKSIQEWGRFFYQDWRRRHR